MILPAEYTDLHERVVALADREPILDDDAVLIIAARFAGEYVATGHRYAIIDTYRDALDAWTDHS